jgi:zinc D-Ala-D-Ala dipeptidase
MTGGDEDRRRSWIHDMSAAARFMAEAGARPVEECLEQTVSIAALADAAGVEIAWGERPHARGLPRLYHLRHSVATALVASAGELNEAGLVLRVEDALRTPEMQANLLCSEDVVDRIIAKVRWEVGHRDPSPQLVCARVAALVSATPLTSTHVSASAVDVSVLDRATGEELDRGGPYLELSELTPMDSPFVSQEARRVRQTLTATLERHGFAAYPYEFWHYSAGDVFDRQVRGSAEPARYGPVVVDLASGQVTPYDHPGTPWGGDGALMEVVLARLSAI